MSIQDPGVERRSLHNGTVPVPHNHEDKTLKPQGECPACDEFHALAPASIPGRRAALAAEKIMAEKKGPYSREQLVKLGKEFGVGRSSISRVIGTIKRRPDLLKQIKDGSVSIAQACRQAGYIEYRLGSRIVPEDVHVQFGKSDKFWESIGPFSIYLKAWSRRDFAFTHLSPKEAARRRKKIESIIEMLEKASDDLAVRSDSTRLTVRSG